MINDIELGKGGLRVAIVVPTYNEVANIEQLLSSLSSHLSKIKTHDFTVLFVDDNSPDETANKIKSIGPSYESRHFRVSLLKRSSKTGLGNAYKAGFSKIIDQNIFDFVIQMDADLSHNPKYIADFIRQAENGADLVVGSRYIAGGDTPDWPVHRKALSRCGNFYARLLLGKQITDYTSGFTMIKTSVLKKIQPKSMNSSGYSFPIELKCRIAGQKSKIVEIPIVFRDRKNGKSKIPKATIFKSLYITTKFGFERLRIDQWARKTFGVIRKESWPILIIMGLLTVKFAHIMNNPEWRDLFLFDTDSLHITHIFQSILSGEPLNWVFSPQMNIFPAGVIYAISMLLGFNVQSTLMINAVLQMMLFYWLIRLIIKLVDSNATLIARQIGALTATSTLLIYMLLELGTPYTPWHHNGTIISLFLLPTYYVDVILASLLLLALSLMISWRQKYSRQVKLLLYLSTIIFATLTMISNPLLAVYFVLPFTATLGCLWIIKKLKLRHVLDIAWPVYLGVVAGYIARIPLKGHMTQALGNKIRLEEIEPTWQLIVRSFDKMLHSWHDIVIIIIFGSILLFIGRKLAELLRVKNSTKQYGWFIVVIFSFVAPILIFVTTILTGLNATRFLLPMFIFPLVAVSLFVTLYATRQMISRISVIACCLAVTVLAIFSAPSAVNLATTTDPKVPCVLEFIGDNNAVADYALAKRYEIYRSGEHKGRVVQVTGNGKVNPWLVNMSVYDKRQYNYVLTEASGNNARPFTLFDSSDKHMLHNRQSTDQFKICGNIRVTYYPVGSLEFQKLNQSMAGSLRAAHRASEQNNMPRYFDLD